MKFSNKAILSLAVAIAMQCPSALGASSPALRGTNPSTSNRVLTEAVSCVNEVGEHRFSRINGNNVAANFSETCDWVAKSWAERCNIYEGAKEKCPGVCERDCRTGCQESPFEVMDIYDNLQGEEKDAVRARTCAAIKTEKRCNEVTDIASHCPVSCPSEVEAAEGVVPEGEVPEGEVPEGEVPEQEVCDYKDSTKTFRVLKDIYLGTGHNHHKKHAWVRCNKYYPEEYEEDEAYVKFKDMNNPKNFFTVSLNREEWCNVDGIAETCPATCFGHGPQNFGQSPPPTASPTGSPTESASPTDSGAPSLSPTGAPSSAPTRTPTAEPN